MIFISSFLLMKFNIVNKAYIYSFFLILISCIIMESHKGNLDNNKYNNKVTLIITIILSIIFGLFHLFNFETKNESIFNFLLLFSVSKIITGIILSVIRLRYGIIISFLFHSIFNLIIYTIQ